MRKNILTGNQKIFGQNYRVSESQIFCHSLWDGSDQSFLLMERWSYSKFNFASGGGGYCGEIHIAKNFKNLLFTKRQAKYTRTISNTLNYFLKLLNDGKHA